MTRFALRWASLLVAVAMISSCGGDSSTTTPTSPPTTLPPIIRVVVVTHTTTLATAGGSATATVVLRSAAGVILSGRAVTWTSSANAVASIDAAGTVRALSAGAATLTATSEGRSGSTTITVIPVPVATVTVALTNAALFVNDTTQASAQARDATGQVVTGRNVTWSSSAVDVATVSTSGAVRAIAPGTATITATSEGRSGSATVTVAPIPVESVTVSVASASIVVAGTTQATAVLRGPTGQALTGRVVNWTSSAPQIATVSESGVVQGVAPGTASITATAEGKTASVQVTVTPVPIASITIAYSPSMLTPGRTALAVASLRDAAGAVLTGRAVNWASSDETVATVSPSGLITAVAEGSTTVIASSEGATGSAQVTVGRASVATVTVAPASITLSPGQSVPLDAALRDEFQNLLIDRSVTWTTSNASLVGISSDGIVTGLAPGTATISATSEGKTGTASVTVTSTAVASVSLSSSSFSIAAGEVRAIIATARDAQGNALPGRAVSWFSSNLNVVDGFVFGDTAVITGLQPGSAVVAAEIGGRQASILVTVSAPTSNVCAAIAGASIFANDGTYLGRFTNRFDAQSVLNRFGQYGSRYAANSTNNQYGRYGSPYSSESARNPFTSTPPVVVKNGQAIAFYTVNSFRTPAVAPAFALTCNFP